MKYPPHPLTRDQANAMIAAAADSRQNGLRESAHLTVLYRTGMRCAESCNLDMADIRRVMTPSGRECWVVRIAHPKGWKNQGAMPREIGLDRQATEVLDRWIAQRGSAAGPVFQASGGNRVSPSHIRRTISRLGSRAGIERRVHAHAFRHTFAKELYDEGVGLVHIMRALGHASLDTTQHYLQSIGANEVVSVTSARSDWMASPQQKEQSRETDRDGKHKDRPRGPGTERSGCPLSGQELGEGTQVH